MQIAANATRIMKNWGNTLELVESESSAPRMMKCHSAQGELLVEQEMPHEYEGFPNVYVNRGLTQKRIYDYAVSLGIEFNFNCKITRYFEEESCAGIFVGDTRYTADAVIVGDGVHSRARELITRKGDAAQPSGFAIYRSWFSLNHLRGDPLLEEICNSKEDVFLMWIGTNTHSILMTNVKLNFVVIFCIHTVWPAPL
jgi:2-polyprenyl-6-methoxyphenol hydroxylase-like FAD-dependent oxidoreductase